MILVGGSLKVAGDVYPWFDRVLQNLGRVHGEIYRLSVWEPWTKSGSYSTRL